MMERAGDGWLTMLPKFQEVVSEAFLWLLMQVPLHAFPRFGHDLRVIMGDLARHVEPRRSAGPCCKALGLFPCWACQTSSSGPWACVRLRDARFLVAVAGSSSGLVIGATPAAA